MPKKYSNNKDKLIFLIFLSTILLVFSFAKEISDLFPDSFFRSNILLIKLICGFVFVLVLTSIYFSIVAKYKIYTTLSNDKTIFLNNSKELFHSSFTNFSVLIIAIISLLYGIYSDVFYQQGSPIYPVINGLNNNKARFELDSLNSSSDTTKLVFAIDISGSVKINANELDAKKIAWIRDARSGMGRYKFLKRSADIDNIVSIIEPSAITGIQLIKLKAAKLILDNIEGLKNANRRYKLSVFFFGHGVDVIDNIDISDQDKIENLVITILKREPTKVDASQTEIGELITKINYFIQPSGNRDGFKRPNTVVTILSDFINDSENQDSLKLCSLIAGLSNKSTYFNLFLFEPKQSKESIKQIKTLPIFRDNLHSQQVNSKRIEEEIDLRAANFKSPRCVTFLINKPFHVSKCSTQIKLSADADTEVYVKLFKSNYTQNDDWQQYFVNDRQLLLNSNDTLKKEVKENYIIFSGHAPSQFSNTLIEFEFPNAHETISAEVIFKKGLSNFISRILFTSVMVLLLINAVYLYYLIKMMINNIKKEVEGNTKALSVEVR